MNKLIFIGPCGGGKLPTNGASAKNHQIVTFFKKHNIKLTIIDTEKWKKTPLVLFQLFFSLFVFRGRYIVSANNTSSYRLLSVLTILPFRKFVAYWVIGGSIADWVKERKVASKPFKKVDLILVEGERMKNLFSECGIENVEVVPNFKVIEFLPEKDFTKKNEVKFVFLSRIIRDKGVDVIINAVKQLNKKRSGFTVDFYGPFESSFQEEFIASIKNIENIKYKGFLDLNDVNNYKKLAEYDVMLFPTYWHGEGFPGVFVDAFIAGLPVIATNWSMNGELIKEGVNGWLIPPHDIRALARVMEEVLDNRTSVIAMAKTCQVTAHHFDINNVINKGIMERLTLFC